MIDDEDENRRSGGGHLFDNHDEPASGGGAAGVSSHYDSKHSAGSGGLAAAGSGGQYSYHNPNKLNEGKATESGYQRRSKNFHLTRILLKTVASMAEAGELTLPQKGLLKDRIVDQDTIILQVAETYDAENDLNDFKESLIQLAEISAQKRS